MNKRILLSKVSDRLLRRLDGVYVELPRSHKEFEEHWNIVLNDFHNIRGRSRTLGGLVTRFRAHVKRVFLIKNGVNTVNRQALYRKVLTALTEFHSEELKRLK